MADEVEQWITGIHGVAQARLLFVRGGRVYVVDSDGWGERQVSEAGLALSPAWSPDGHTIAYSILGAATLIDLAIYGRLKDLTVCYRCHSEFRGTFEHKAVAFDLHTADVLEMEYERRIGRR